jgi:hypothetical protein
MLPQPPVFTVIVYNLVAMGMERLSSKHSNPEVRSYHEFPYHE